MWDRWKRDVEISLGHQMGLVNSQRRELQRHLIRLLDCTYGADSHFVKLTCAELDSDHSIQAIGKPGLQYFRIAPV